MANGDDGVRGLHLKSGLILLGIFLAGALTGGGVVRWLGPRPMHPPPGLGPMPGRMPALLGELDLSREQHEQARAIVEKYRPQMEAIFRDTFPRARDVGERMEQELRGILTPEQQRRLDELKARGPRRGMGMGPMHGMGPPGLGPPPMEPPPPADGAARP